MTLCCRVIDASGAFTYPAEYKVDDEKIDAVVSFTATYVGQAWEGELIEAAGILEQSELGGFRLVVGGSREAYGEYIKVLRLETLL
jgi:predicted nucleotidyltransferase